MANDPQHPFRQFQYPTSPLGAYDSGFPDEHAYEDWLCRLDRLADDHRQMVAGEHVSGPAADTYRHRIHAAHHQFAGRVLTNHTRARDMLTNPLLQIYPGRAMTCVFDPAKALCQLRTTDGDVRRTPDQDDCRPNCQNVAYTTATSPRCAPEPRDCKSSPPTTSPITTAAAPPSRTRPPHRHPAPARLKDVTVTHGHRYERLARPRNRPGTRRDPQRRRPPPRWHTQRSTGNLSVVQLAVEANLKYWIVVQKHTDLRDHFQRLSAKTKGPAIGPSDNDEPETKHRQLRQHYAHLEALVQTYAAVINELARENAALREQQTHATVTPLKRPTSPPQPPTGELAAPADPRNA